MGKRVLFVDDEPSILGVYKMLPPFLGEDYSIATAGNGREALERISEGEFDVVVSDLMMPGMSGAELLRRVSETLPSAARVVVSGFADDLTVAKCLLAGHRYFTKPFNPIALTETIQGLNRARAAVRSGGLRNLVGRFDALPTPSETYLQLMKALNGQDVPLGEVAKIVEQDPSLAAKVLQAVNSAMFGGSRQMRGLEEALQMIGLHVLRALALTIQVFEFYQNPALQKQLLSVWEHSALIAQGAKQHCVNQQWPAATVEEAFLSGLLHDIGKVILLATPERERSAAMPEYRAPAEGETRACPLGEALEAEAGAYLLALWGIPEPIVEAVRSYRTTSLAGGVLSPAVQALAVAHDLERVAA